jgi:hypothetical protein
MLVGAGFRQLRAPFSTACAGSAAVSGAPHCSGSSGARAAAACRPAQRRVGGGAARAGQRAARAAAQSAVMGLKPGMHLGPRSGGERRGGLVQMQGPELGSVGAGLALGDAGPLRANKEQAREAQAVHRHAPTRTSWGPAGSATARRLAGRRGRRGFSGRCGATPGWLAPPRPRRRPAPACPASRAGATSRRHIMGACSRSRARVPRCTARRRYAEPAVRRLTIAAADLAPVAPPLANCCAESIAPTTLESRRGS